MSQANFEAQATMLEREFYGGIDRELIVQVQEHIERCCNGAASAFPGISNERILSELQSAEITPKTLMAFALFPSIYVAWSDADLAENERNAILKAAETVGVISGSPAFGLLNSWLNKKPMDELFAAWKEFVIAVRPALSDEAFQELRDAASTRARNVAAAAGGILGVFKISSSEEKALTDLEQVFAEALR
ncbi:MAG: hypothetical protein U0936_12145 [Planctomycetaceae bacterium]